MTPGRDFTNTVAAALQRAWWGRAGSTTFPVADPAVAGGIRIAASAFSRALAQAIVTGPEPARTAVEALLPLVGVAYCSRGELVALADFDDGLRLDPVSIVEGTGKPGSVRWTVRQTDAAGDRTDRTIDASELLHAIWSPTEDGLRGCAPWQGSLGEAHANLERAISDEAMTALGQAVLMTTPAAGAAMAGTTGTSVDVYKVCETEDIIIWISSYHARPI